MSFFLSVLGGGRRRGASALVLSGDPDDPRPYGTNRYVGYDRADEPLPAWFTIDIPEPVPPMTRVVGVRTDDGELAVPTELVATRGVVTTAIGDREFAIFHTPGTASPLHRSGVADGDDIGATGVFDTKADAMTTNPISSATATTGRDLA